MKNILFVAIIVVFITGGYMLFNQVANKPVQLQQNSETISYVLEGKEVQLLVADNNAERQKGLMFVRKLKDADGMIFRFEQTQVLSFWNQNTLMDLDVYWIKNGKVVGKSYLPSIEKSKNIVTIHSPEPVDTAIEIPR